MNKRNGLLMICLLVGTLALQAQEQGKATATEPVTQKESTTVAPASTQKAEEAKKSQEEASPEGFVAPREEVKEKPAPAPKALRVVFNPKTQKDPTLSPDDVLLIKYREQQRLAALEAERKRKLEEERRRLEEEERRRQAELARIKDPSREVRNRIRVAGIIGQEVMIGDKLYTVGNAVFGARIVEVHADYVIFSYKGHRFRKNVLL